MRKVSKNLKYRVAIWVRRRKDHSELGLLTNIS
jgi:hypothetical protein